MADDRQRETLGPRRAFDDVRPPEQTLIDDCVHCGFCLPTCPTYVVWGEEMDSPRGRIVLMKEGLQPGSELSDQMAVHFDRCLGCMACVTACPSGVRYDLLIEAVRPQIERNHDRPLSQRLLRTILLGVFTNPLRVRMLVPMLAAYRKLGIDRRFRDSGLLDRFPKLRALLSLSPPIELSAAIARLPVSTPARGDRRARVGLVQGCAHRVFFSEVNRAAVEVLASEGCEVFAPSLPRCCGALMIHSGYEPPALELAKEVIEAFKDCDFVVVNAAGCGSAMKDYGHLLRDDHEWSDRAERFSAKVRDVSELLVELGKVAERGPVAMKVAYHDACHLAHAQRVREQPRSLLGTVPGLEVLEPEGWEVCCGSAGIYNLLEVEAGEELGRAKAERLLATGADAIVSGNPGCTLQIAAHLRALGRPLPIYHPVQLLHESIRQVSEQRSE